MSYDVTLPIDQQPIYPDMCPVCGREGVNHAVRLRGPRGVVGGPWSMLPGGTVEAVIPAHKGCATRYTWGRRLEKLLDYAIPVACAAAAFYFFRFAAPGVSKGWRTFWFFAAGGAGIAGNVAWSLLRPKAVEITVWNRKMDYEFRSRDYAQAFAVANGVPLHAVSGPIAEIWRDYRQARREHKAAVRRLKDLKGPDDHCEE